MSRRPEAACPRCLGPLIAAEESARCPACGVGYRSLLGIPDLRVAEDQFLANDADWAHARRLAEDYHRLDFRGLLERHYDLGPPLPPDLRRRQIGHILTGPVRAAGWLDAVDLRPDAPILDLGCGAGSLLAAVAGRGLPALGVDIAMRWLVLARKRLDELGYAGYPLVCGCAERLPAGSSAFGGVFGGDVIEHVADIGETLAEAHRVLRPGGVLFLATPNRFSLAPEPHVGVWGVGYLPRPLMGPYVAWRRKLDFRAIYTLGFGGWRRKLADSPFLGGGILTPGLTAIELAGMSPGKRRLGQLYNALIRSPPGRVASRRVGPLFHMVCRRPEDSDRAPRPGSTPGSGGS